MDGWMETHMQIDGYRWKKLEGHIDGWIDTCIAYIHIDYWMDGWMDD